MQSASHVRISEPEVDKFAAEFISKRSHDFRGEIEWDSLGWHYTEKNSLTAQYVFVLDALNFCFWPATGLEYEQLATSLRDVLTSDPGAFNGNKLRSIDSTQLQSWFPTHSLPQLDERVVRLQELGSVLEEDYGGLAINMAAAADGSGEKLVRLVIEKVPGFRDTTIYKGRVVHFYKRAQILTSDLWAAYGRLTDRSHPCAFSDMEGMTMFADYRVPQILRSLGVMEYSDTLAKKIDAHDEIPFGSEEETEIRAATVVAVEKIRAALEKRGMKLLDIECDWVLWNQGELKRHEIAPHHRTLTIYY
jgi:hypothetical protein